MVPYFGENFGNASSVHWYGQQAKHALENSREVIAAAIGAQPREVFFTSGGTESNNLALKGVVTAAKKSSIRPHIVSSMAEHHAVLEPCEKLTHEGCDVTLLPVDVFGLVSPSQVSDSLTESTCLVSIMMANNEVGSLSPIAEIAAVTHQRKVLCHTDAVQALGRLPINVSELGVDLMSLSAHKIYGPKGIGALYVRGGTLIEPIIHGGGQERGKRSGTENVPLAVGFAKAVELMLADMDSENTRLRSLRDALEAGIRSRLRAAMVNGHPTNRLPHILNISLDSKSISLEGEMLLLNLDLRGIALTSGSACTSGSMQPSHVLLAMGRDVRTARATLRFAFGRKNTREDVDDVLEVLISVIRQMTNDGPTQSN
jgi:cysteine desulfurase